MCKETKIVILGGDARFEVLYQDLKSKYDTTFFAEEKDLPLSAFKACDYLILPLPCTLGNSTILKFSPKLDLNDIFPHLSHNCHVLAGKVPENLKRLALQHNIDIYDYYTDEFEVLNAIPSAEGAIEIAMRETDFTLCGSKIYVLGYGRIGKILSKMLSGIGAEVTVLARRKESLAMAKAMGLKVCSLSSMACFIKDADIIFNTIPSLILNHEILSDIKKDTLIIDLASSPGGVDFTNAEHLGLKTIHALGLPAKTSPKTSSEILSRCISSYIEERRTNGT